MWCQYTLIKCNNSPFPEVDVLRQISLQRFMPCRCISQLFPRLRVQSISALFGKTTILQGCPGQQLRVFLHVRSFLKCFKKMKVSLEPVASSI